MHQVLTENITTSIKINQNGVTIGIPLYNEAEFIEKAIRSAAPQCEALIVADNCSSDCSESICKELAKNYPNLLYIKHEINMGAAKNFEFVMKSAKTEYFMWLGAHDYIPDDYTEKLVRKLKTDSEAIMAYGKSEHVSRTGATNSVYDYFYSDQLANIEPSNRLMGIIQHLDDCSLIHGIFVRKKLVNIWEDFNYLAADHVLLAKAALAGKFIYEPTVHLYRRDVHINDNLSKQLKRILGNHDNNKLHPTKTEMQKIQYEMACKEAKIMGADSLYYRLKCHFILTSRFGPFSGNTLISYLEYILWIKCRTFRLIRRKIKEARLPKKLST